MTEVTTRKIIPIAAERLQALREEAMAASDANYAKIVAESPWLGRELSVALNKIAAENSSARSKYAKFRALADRIAASIAPHSACSQGCSHCCHIAVTIPAIEAEQIGVAIGRKSNSIDGQIRPDKMIVATDRWKGVPCTFLKDGECSIYAYRPIACRVHFTIGASATLCDTDVPSEDSVIPNIDLAKFWLAYASIMAGKPFADLREFFEDA